MGGETGQSREWGLRGRGLRAQGIGVGGSLGKRVIGERENGGKGRNKVEKRTERL